MNLKSDAKIRRFMADYKKSVRFFFDNDVSGNSPESIGNFVTDNNKTLIYDNVANNQNKILKKHPTRGTASEVTQKENWPGLKAEEAGAGVLGRFYSWFKDAPTKLQGLSKANKGAAHEFAHYVYMPFSMPKGFDVKALKSPTLLDYFIGPPTLRNTGEIMARGTQLKNYFGLKEGEQLTPEMWEYAQRHYAKNVADNTMTNFFLSGNNKYPNFPLLLKLINKHAPMLGFGTISTGTLLNAKNNE